MATPSENDAPDDTGLPSGTRIESVEAIRQAHQARTATVVERVSGPPAAGQAAGSSPAQGEPFRPVRRPPMALLGVLDDGDDDGEWVRIRRCPFVIGRSDGDLVIPHDDMMSGRHLEIGRQLIKGRWRWILADLSSTNGTFVRVSSIALKPGQELLLGGRRYRFELDVPPVPALMPGVTQGWQAGQAGLGAAALVELLPQGEGQRYPLTQAEHYVGRDRRQCSVVIDDPLLDSRHARLYRNRREQWHLAAAGTVNGVWLRVNRVSVTAACHFQLGEQRFVLRTV